LNDCNVSRSLSGIKGTSKDSSQLMPAPLPATEAD
jgi:hypothetical protein